MMKNWRNIGILPWLILIISCKPAITQTSPFEELDPPFNGTIFLSSDIIKDSDHSTFERLTYTGQTARTMFDRRVNDWIEVSAFLFNAVYEDGLSIEVQVNPEFKDSNTSELEAIKYAKVIGRLPTVLRKDVETVWIHKGIELFGGGNNNLLIHTGQAIVYEEEGILEETLAHEASHTSLDAEHAASSGWVSAQASDGNSISTYARDNPTREDIAESFLLYLAIRHRSDRIKEDLKSTIVETIPNRIAYFDKQDFDMYPIE